MSKEKCYVITERELIDFLTAEMTLSMLETDGVDNWDWYGQSRYDLVAEYHPDETMTPARAREEGLDFYDIAELIVEAGGYPELMTEVDLLPAPDNDFAWTGIGE